MVRQLTDTFAFELPSGHVMTVRTDFDDRGKLVDFAIAVHLRGGTEIARLDTRHGQLHTHYYGQDGQEPERRRVLCDLPSDPVARADDLHARYESCYDVMAAVADGRAP